MITPFLWMVLTAFKSELEIAKFSWLPGELRWQQLRRGDADRAVPALLPQQPVHRDRRDGVHAGGLYDGRLRAGEVADPGRARRCSSYFILLLLVPFQIILVPLFLIVKSIPLFGGNNILGQGGIGWLNSWWGLIIPLGAAPLFTFLARQFYVSIPNELAQAARVDGLGEFGIFWRIMTPLIKPALITICVFQIEAAWNGFLWPLMITTSDEMRPLQLGLAIFAQNPAEVQWPYLMAGTALATLPMIVMFVFAQKRFVEGMANVGIKG